MASTARVTVTLPAELVEEIRLYERDFSRFIAEAVEHELVRRRRQGALRSLQTPHPESAKFADPGLARWAASLPPGEEGLVDLSGGKAVRWIEGRGWVDEDERPKKSSPSIGAWAPE